MHGPGFHSSQDDALSQYEVASIAAGHNPALCAWCVSFSAFTRVIPCFHLCGSTWANSGPIHSVLIAAVTAAAAHASAQRYRSLAMQLDYTDCRRNPGEWRESTSNSNARLAACSSMTRCAAMPAMSDVHFAGVFGVPCPECAEARSVAYVSCCPAGAGPAEGCLPRETSWHGHCRICHRQCDGSPYHIRSAGTAVHPL